jgi:hypothetical protein
MIISLSENLFRILDTYREIIETRPYRRIADIWEPFTSLKKSIEGYLLSNFPTMHVDWSAGQGNWRNEPWIAILDERITKTVQKGYFCAYSFNFDFKYVSLSLVQGVNEIKKQVGRKKLRDVLSQKAKKMRPFYSDLFDYGFSLENNKLSSNTETSLDAISGVVLTKIYRNDSLPSDKQLSQDLIHLLSEYNKYIETSLLKLI